MCADATHWAPPETVRQAVTEIGNKTQRTFINTWLPPFIEAQRPPVLSPQDSAKLSTAQLQQNLKTITGYVDQQFRVISDPSLARSDPLRQLNDALGPLRQTVMSRRLSFDTYNERTQTAQHIFGVVALVGMLGYGIETLPALSPLMPLKTKLMVALDDFGNWAGEIASVKAQGYTWLQTLQSQVLGVPGALWVRGADVEFKERNAAGSGIKMASARARALRGLKLGVAASIVSLGASVSTLMMMTRQHRSLQREGKTTSQPNGVLASWRLALKEAFAQDIQYPARTGLFLGAGLSMTLATLAGLTRVPGTQRFWLESAFVQALIGVGESIGASISSMLAERRENGREQRLLKRWAGEI